MSFLYVLKCGDGDDPKYYVGTTDDVHRRLSEHVQGGSRATAWTQMYRPTEIVETRDCTDGYLEDVVVKQYMCKYGIDNVRGGTFSQRVLPAHVVDILRAEIATASGTCFQCGRTGHFARDCSDKRTACTRCGRSNHTAV